MTAPTLPPAKTGVLGGTIASFTAKFGAPTKDSDLNAYVHYQPYGDTTVTNKFDVSVSNGHVYQVTFNAPPDNPVSWQDGTKMCQSFLPDDAAQQKDTDFNNGYYQQMYMSESMASQFPPDMFKLGRMNSARPITPGTVQIMYHYTSNFFNGDKQVTLCYVSLGQPF